MSYDVLKKFVKQQALKGKNPETLREELMLHGWNESDVTMAINEVYGAKKKITKTILFLIIIIFVVSSISLLLLFKDLYSTNNDVPKPNENQNSQENNIPNQNINLNLDTEDNCEELEYALKENCYLEKIKQNYDCSNLSGDELIFCSRTLENYLLNFSTQ